MTDFRRRKWTFPAVANSVPKKMVQPRLSLILALDTDGKIFFSLSQANNNSNTLILFFQQLVIKLNELRPGWRKNHIFQLDNASYHKSESIIEYFETQKIPIIFSGPHSYDAAPTELCFASLKSVNLNPDDVKTSKSKYLHFTYLFLEFFL